ncbi:MAG: DNA translocase FtsK, partial [Lysobacter sp.]
VTHLGLELSDHISFVVGEDLVVRKLKFLDGAVESLEAIEAEDLRAELDARFALQTGEIRELFDVLERCFKLSAVESTGDGAAATTSPLAAAPGAFDDDADPLLAQAKAFVVESGKSSISYLQRVLKVGYNRAARLIETLEAAGVVSAPDFKGVRRVLSPT